MKEAIKYIIYILTLGYIFGPPLHILPTWLNVGILSSILFIFIFLYYAAITESKIKLTIGFVSVYFIFILVYLVLIIYHYILVGENSGALINVLFRMCVFVTISAMVAILYYNMNVHVNSFIKLVMTFLILNSFLMVIMVAFPDLQHLIDQYINHTGNITDYEDRLRFRGVLNIEGDSLGMLYSLYFAFLTYINKYCDRSEKMFFFTGVPIIFLGILFSGRSGFITLSVILFGPILMSNRIIIGKLLLIMSSLITSVLTVYYVGILTDSAEEFVQWVIFEIPSGIDALFGRHIFLPSDWFTFVFGGEGYTNQYNPNTAEIMTSDSGYIREVFSIGVFFILVIWGKMVHFSSYLNIKTKQLYLILLLALAVGNLKTPTLFNPLFIKLISTLLFISILNNSRDRTEVFG